MSMQTKFGMQQLILDMYREAQIRGEMLLSQYPFGHTQSPPNLVHTSWNDLAMITPSFAVLPPMWASNENS